METSDDGSAQEKTFRCDQIKGVAELFDQGVRDRELAREQKEQEKNQRHEEHLREQELRYQQKVAKNELYTKARRAQLKQEDRRQGRTALKRVKKIINSIVGAILILTFLPLVMTQWGNASLSLGEKIFFSIVLIFLIGLAGVCLYRLLMLPVYLTQYHAETIKKAILVASGKDEYDDDEFDED